MNLTRIQSNNAPQSSEETYRAIKDKLNSSAIRVFINDRQKFLKEFILNEPREQKDTASTIMGSIVHCLILERERFDDKYAIASMTPPVGQMKELCDNLYARTVKCMDKNGQVTLQMSVLMEQAIQDTKYNFDGTEKAFKGKSIEKIVDMFSGDPELYYKELRSNYGKTVVSIYQIEKAEAIVNEMKNNSYINEWVNTVSSDTKEVYNELPIMFKYMDMDMKALLDRVIVCHTTMTIQPIDIKSGWDLEGFSYSYCKMGYYIQAAFYKQAILSWAENNDLGGYTILPLMFLVCDTGGYMRSVCYKLTGEDIIAAEEGFRIGNKEYTGLLPALREIRWCQDQAIWNCSKEVVDKQGILSIGLNYE